MFELGHFSHQLSTMSWPSADEAAAVFSLLKMSKGAGAACTAPPPARRYGMGHGYHPMGDVRLNPNKYAGAIYDRELCVTFVSMMAAGDFVFPGHMEPGNDASAWRFYAITSSALPAGACCVIWYTDPPHDTRCVSPAGIRLGLRTLTGDPVRGSLYAAVVAKDGRAATAPTQQIFGGVLTPVAHAPELVVHVPSLLHTAALRGKSGAL